MPHPTQPTPTPPLTPDELRRHARMLRRAAGRLDAAADSLAEAERVRREIARMLAPVLQWGQQDKAA